MRAHNRDPALQASLEQVTGVARLPSLDADGREQDGSVWEMDHHEQANLERATREVAEFQVYWRSRTSQCIQADSPQLPNVIEPSDIQGNQAMTKLHIAQTEWKKLLDGSGGEDARQPLLPVTEAMQNTFWGDPCEAKAGHLFRLYVQNVNGLPLDRRGGQFDTLCQVIKETQADVFLGQEHNLDSTQPPVRNILQETSKQHWERYRLNIATTPIPFRSMYKPGGTFMLTVGNATGRILSQSHDKWGRWVSQTFQGAEGRTITMVSAYQVVTDTIKGGTTTVASQQYSLLLNEQDSTKAPRAAFRKDLKLFLQKCRNKGEELILVGNLN